jgi:two-component system cell cycle sensor histidine kinase/response regulator CckA
VLVAEDQVELRNLVGAALSAYGYAPILADNTDEALLMLADNQRHIDLLLTDVSMPGMSGVELAANASALRPALKVLYMSGHTPNPEYRALFADNGAAYLQKPFTPQELAARIALLLAKPK